MGEHRGSAAKALGGYPERARMMLTCICKKCVGDLDADRDNTPQSFACTNCGRKWQVYMRGDAVIARVLSQATAVSSSRQTLKRAFVAPLPSALAILL